jgi:hypothetical protein
MTRDPNPFEPWRPRPGECPPPAIDLHRPWRPRRTPEPAAYPVPDPVPGKAETKSGTGTGSGTEAPAFEPRPDNLAILTTVLLLLLAVAILTQGGADNAHLPRILAALAAVGAGWGVSVSLARRRPMPVRLGWIGAGVLAALAVRWFVPTVHGVSLWEAGGLAAETEAIPAGDVVGYTAGARHRKAAVSDYAGEIKAADRAWMRRTADAAIASSRERIERDPAQASHDLHLLAGSLERLDHWAEVRDDLRAVRRKALHACVQRLEKECEALIARGEFTAVSQHSEKALAEWSNEARQLGLQDEGRPQVLNVRRKAVLAALDAARREVMPLLARDRFGAVAALGEQLAHVLAEEARLVGAAADLEQFRLACEAFGELAKAGRPEGR